MRMPTLPQIPLRQRSAGPGARSGIDGRATARPAGRASAPPAAPRPGRQVRGLTFLALLVATLVTGTLAAFGILLWIAPGIAAAATLGGFVWLRSAVQAEIKARRAARRPVRRARSDGARHWDGATGPDAGHAPGASRLNDEHDVADPGHADELRTSATVLAESDDAGARAQAFERPDGWQPVPVPPPTYTLKAKAERPSPVYDNDLAEPVGEHDGQQEPSPGPEVPGERRAAYGT